MTESRLERPSLRKKIPKKKRKYKKLRCCQKWPQDVQLLMLTCLAVLPAASASAITLKNYRAPLAPYIL